MEIKGETVFADEHQKQSSAHGNHNIFLVANTV